MINFEDIPEISFHAIASVEHPQTLRVLGNLRNKSVTVLIDGGSTYNFIDQAVVSKFGLPVNHSKQFELMMANREKITCNGQCQGLTLNIQGQPITTNYYILLVITCQLVLGVQWLETLGPIEMDFKKLTMSYKK
jgi:predicted aspartyl protease